MNPAKHQDTPHVFPQVEDEQLPRPTRTVMAFRQGHLLLKQFRAAALAFAQRPAADGFLPDCDSVLDLLNQCDTYMARLDYLASEVLHLEEQLQAAVVTANQARPA